MSANTITGIITATADRELEYAEAIARSVRVARVRARLEAEDEFFTWPEDLDRQAEAAVQAESIVTLGERVTVLRTIDVSHRTAIFYEISRRPFTRISTGITYIYPSGGSTRVDVVGQGTVVAVESESDGDGSSFAYAVDMGQE